MTIDHRKPWHLQLLGRPMDGGPLNGLPRPLGERVFLQPGALADEGSGLGLTNHGLIPLPAAFFRAPWLLEGYQFWDGPAGGRLACELQISQPLLLHQQRLEAIPPWSIQPYAAAQPAFSVSTFERNPCPGWAERIHLYQVPGQPFEASAVIYTDTQGLVAAAELFHVSLRTLAKGGEYQSVKRCWIKYTY